MQNEESKPLISVCIPTYNGEKYLHECINSVLFQTFADFELLICDDCSTDATVEIVKSFQEKDKRIKLTINEKNLGLVGNWNQCIKCARGEWIKFVFQDDIIVANCIQKMLAPTKEYTRMVICERTYLFEENVSERIKKTYRIRRLFEVTNNGSTLQEISAGQLSKYAAYLAPNNFIGEPSSVMFKKSCYTELGGFTDDIVQMCDLEYWLRIGLNYGFVYVNESMVNFRVHLSSTSQKNNSEKYFIAHYIDKVELIHLMLYAQEYQNFRSLAGWYPLVLLRYKFFYIIFNARRFLKKEKNLMLNEEWEIIRKKYSEVSKAGRYDNFYYCIGIFLSVRRRLLGRN